MLAVGVRFGGNGYDSVGIEFMPVSRDENGVPMLLFLASELTHGEAR